MFTIIQRQYDGSFDVVAKVRDYSVARELACTLCNQAQVARTLVLDDLGCVVSGES